MRRGLISWNPDELPLELLRQRTGRLRQAMRTADCDAVLLYTNFIRCAAVSWLTGFSPYWADGILVVSRDGDPVFATSLSKRMGSWIQGVMPNGTVVTTASPGQLAGKRLAETGARRIGILELPDFPAGLYGDLAGRIPDSEFVDAAELFKRARFPADAAEWKLLGCADRIAQTAVDSVSPDALTSVGGLVGAVEKSARLDGAEEVYVAVAPDLDRSRSFLRLSGGAPLGRRFSIRATVAYKGGWVRRIRTMSQDPGDAARIRYANSWFAGLTGHVPTEHLPDLIQQQIVHLPDAVLDEYFVEMPVGTRPLSVPDSPPIPGAPLVLTVKITVSGMPWVGAGLIAGS